MQPGYRAKSWATSPSPLAALPGRVSRIVQGNDLDVTHMIGFNGAVGDFAPQLLAEHHLPEDVTPKLLAYFRSKE